MSKEIKKLYIDTETTGLDNVKNDVIQMSGFIQIDCDVVETFDIRCQPFSFENVTKEAFEKHNITIKQLQEYQTPKQAYDQIIGIFGKYVNKYDKADKFIPCGQNLEFDLGFMQQFFMKNNDKFFYSWTTRTGIDLMHLASILRATNRIDIENLKLETICKHLGVQFDAHNAMSDIAATKQCIEYFIEKYMPMTNGESNG